MNDPGYEAPIILGVNSLPFGSVASVAAFLRISCAFWRVGIYLLRLVWSTFFDDYSCICPEVLQDNTRWTIEMLLDLLGVVFAREGRKAEPFSASFRMLGLVVNLERSEARQMLIGHTPERREELMQYIQEILDSGLLDKRICDRLRGRMVFFEGFTFGRVSSRAIRVVSKACEGVTGTVSLSADVRGRSSGCNFAWKAHQCG